MHYKLFWDGDYMGSFFISGGNKISGEISIGGAKNAALPILSAAALINGESIIKNVPNISDVKVAINILKNLGFNVSYEKNTITISGKMTSNVICKEDSEKMRSSITFLGSIIGRVGEGSCYFPGGCPLGERPIELHKYGFEKLGINIIETEEKLICKGKPVGANIDLSFPSVGATINIILASVYAEGMTKITNAAKEPEVVDMINFLNKCGAKIKDGGTSEIKIEGVKNLSGCEYEVMPDRIIAGTYLAAAAVTCGDLILNNIDSSSMYPITSKFSQMGVSIKTSKNTLEIKNYGRLSSVKVKTGVHPYFPTDMQAQTMAALSTALGVSEIHETIFEARDKHVKELIKMGAKIDILNGSFFLVRGVKKLVGTEVEASDLRGGAALIIAALAAEGKTIIKGASHIERGYEDIARDLNILGANIYKG